MNAWTFGYHGFRMEYTNQEKSNGGRVLVVHIYTKRFLDCLSDWFAVHIEPENRQTVIDQCRAMADAIEAELFEEARKEAEQSDATKVITSGS